MGQKKRYELSTHYGIEEVVTNENMPNYWGHWFE